MVNIGIVGIGFMGMTHYKAMAQVQGGQVAAIVSRDPKKRGGIGTIFRVISAIAGECRTCREYAATKRWTSCSPMGR